MRIDVPIEAIEARAFTIPTDQLEADGTLHWDKTTIVIVWVRGGGQEGIGYTYADTAAADLISSKLSSVVKGMNAMSPPSAWRAMQHAIRNLGRSGLVATAISAVDVALHDLKAKLLDLPLAILLGLCRTEIPIYGSGGFTSYTDEKLQSQLSQWVEVDGCAWVKMKIGAAPDRDLDRVSAAKEAIGQATLFVDANGAYDVKQALWFAERFVDYGIGWFEEPVSSDDLAGLQLVRRRAPPVMEIAAGEYGYTIDYFRTMLQAEAIDVQQADITRCGGVTGFLRVAALCEAHHRPLSAHCGPAIHLHAACAAPWFRHQEWFHDHVRLEAIAFDGAPVPQNGTIRPDLSRPGIGLTPKMADLEPFAH